MGTLKWLGVLLIKIPNCCIASNTATRLLKEAEKLLETFVKLGIKKHT